MRPLPDLVAESLETIPLVQTILDELRVAVLYVDAQLRVVAHAPVPKAFFPHAEGKLVDQPVTELFPELIGAEDDLAAVASGRVPRFDLPMINRPGPESSDRLYLSLTAILHPEDLDQLVVLVYDVTAEGRLRQQIMQQLNETRLLRARLEEANRALVRLDAEKSGFLRMAAHDLRAPLTVIRSYVEVVREAVPPDTDGEVVTYLNVVMARTQQMADLIADLLDVEKIELGAVALDRQPVDLGALVQQVGLDYAALARQQGIELQWHIPASVPQPHADRARLEQALGNLVSNGVKFTPAGGQVDIDVLMQEGNVAIEVTDTGPGISEEDQAQLFQRFFRSDAARMRHIPGTGLGLSIVRSIMELHGGQVYCRSHLGAGSTFGLLLPIEQG